MSRGGGLMVLALILAACGGGGGGGGGIAAVNPNAPVISELQVQPLDPETLNRNVRYVVAFNFVDVPGDVVNGQCEIALNGQELNPVTIQPVGGVGPNATSGGVACLFVVFPQATPLRIEGRVRISDRAGNDSNDLTFALGIGRAAQLPGSGAESSGEGGFIGEKACALTAQAFGPAVQSLIGKAFRRAEFAELLR